VKNIEMGTGTYQNQTAEFFSLTQNRRKKPKNKSTPNSLVILSFMSKQKAKFMLAV